MSYRLDFLPQVEHDVQDAYDWYELQLPGLGEDFLLSTDAAINAIARQPLLSAVEYKGVRKLKQSGSLLGCFMFWKKIPLLLLLLFI